MSTILMLAAKLHALHTRHVAESKYSPMQFTQQKLTPEEKLAIEADAQAAFHRGEGPLKACPWPVHTLQDDHWKAAWIMAGGTLN
jgi:hypothetical protein